MAGFVFNPPPGWPTPPPGWKPPTDWVPDPTWPKAPDDWVFWIPASDAEPGDSAAAVKPPDPIRTVTPTAVSRPSTPTMPLAAAAPPIATTPAGPPEFGSPDDELRACRAKVAELEADLAQVRSQGGALGEGFVDLSDERVLQEVGIYHYHHPLEDSAEYRDRLRDIQQRIDDFARQGTAILASDMFTFNNSLAKGRKMTSDLSKLMLRAYNAEADNCVRSLRSGNVVTAKNRLQASVSSIAKLGAIMEMRVNPDYHALRIQELELTADFQMKVQEEREHAREERERLREERKAELELAAERERLDKERAHLANALEALKASGDEAGSAALEAKLQELDEAIAQNDYRAANIRAGYVYVISNRGAFGTNMVKIGMTRRLEPMDRVRELGDASVPFPFNVHALFFSEDAVTIEAELHRAFASERVNMVNDRREFFFATPLQVRAVLAEKVGNLLEFADEPEATEYLQSRKYWPAST